MTNWLTTHWPHPQPDTHPWHIYLQRQHKNAVESIAIGDVVFFYEYSTQKPIKGGPRYPAGAQGIVRIAKVSGRIYHRDSVIEYADGTIGYWSWGVPTDQEDTDGLVPRADVLKVIGYKPGSNLRGFNSGTGVMRLDDEQRRSLEKLFKLGVRKRQAGARFVGV